ncbi:beta-N-acetylhexosaminidase [Pedobacter chitinilyticus]|uniref:beta-N-acetylhexosaminidase n=1 Tax=Pedobacter chitinilyticus TaxID=2233776 RepID=A0A443YZS8_9SPHI|nr:beta-N-acetylhexosaminidase [Pedobacter chitinilyticus]RWU09797.1 beta-N-acetylhexosaminidase [Pedobacter chitinilyticus]
MKRIVLAGLMSLISVCAIAQVNIIPKPVSLKVESQQKGFSINTQTRIVIENDSLRSAAVFFNDYLEQYLQFKLTITSVKPTENYISLSVNTSINKFDDAYELGVFSQNISLTGTSNRGVFYGVQTLIQLLPVTKAATLTIPAVIVTDYPRFAYRGMHLDVSRHFFDIDFIKKYIDYLAMRKMNYFHWHLTDDHGWRIEIKKYPKLTEIGAWRNGSIIGLWPGKGNENIKYQVLPNDVKITPANAVIKTDGIRHGGYYTQEEIKEVIRYAADRYVTIIPEIEMPAHSMAALAAYPEFGTEPNKPYKVAETWGMMNKYNNVFQPNDKTFSFLEDVLTEVMNLFPSPYIHIGGDEASKVWWKQSAETQKIMKEKGFKDEVALQSYFIHRIEKFVNSKGKTIIGWDEILDGGLAPNAVVMSWRGEKGGIAAAKVKQKVVMSPEEKLYLNHKQFMKEDSLAANKFLPLETVYNYEPVPAELNAEQAKYIWGAQGNLWSEYIASPAKVEYMLFPRMDALSEIQWSQKEQKNYADFLNRLKTQFKRYDLMGITYSKRYLNPAAN